MKAWDVTIRGANGKPEIITISAETREEVFAKLAKVGKHAVRVDATSGEKARKSFSKAMPPKTKKYSLAFALFSLFIVIAIFSYFNQRRESPIDNIKDDKAPTKVTVVTPSPRTNKVNKVKTPKKKSSEDEIIRRREMLKKMTPEQKLDFLFEQAQKRPLPQEPSSNRIYRTSIEQVMDWVFSCEVGNPPPLLPQMSMFDEAHLAEILLMDNPIKETDNEKVRESKEMMKIAKKEFIDFIKKGGDPHEFLPYYHGQLVQAHEEWKMARKSIFDIVKSEPEIAIEYIKKINSQLEEKGIKKVTVPPKMLERFGIQLEE